MKASYLSATCDFAPDRKLLEAWQGIEGVIITQGFIAANPELWAEDIGEL